VLLFFVSLDSFFSKMPFPMGDIADFFAHKSHFILRDFQEITLLHKSRDNFLQKTFERWFFDSENIEDKFSGVGPLKIVFDGQENFQNGLSHFCFYAVQNRNFLLLDPILNIFYWGQGENLFINSNKIHIRNSENGHCRFLTKIFPSSLAVCSFLSGAINMTVGNEDLKFLLENMPVTDGIFFKNGIDKNEDFTYNVNFLSKK